MLLILGWAAKQRALLLFSMPEDRSVAAAKQWEQ
jgi:hypothetical protein